MCFKIRLVGEHMVDVVGPTWSQVVNTAASQACPLPAGAFLTGLLQLGGLVSHRESLEGTRKQVVIRAKQWVGPPCFLWRGGFIAGYRNLPLRGCRDMGALPELPTIHLPTSRPSLISGSGFQLPELDQGPLGLPPELGAGLWDIFKAPCCSHILPSLCLIPPSAAPWPIW